MEVSETDIPGVKVIFPDCHRDSRGYFAETYNEERYRAAGIDAVFVQDNESCSSRGVLRGLHWQAGAHAQAKLVRVVKGKVLDVAVDLRKDSPTFGQHVAMELSDENRRQMFIPRGFAHGFSVLSEEAVFQYKCDSYYAPESEGSLAWNDPDLNIDWNVPAGSEILSDKDRMSPRLKDIIDTLE